MKKGEDESKITTKEPKEIHQSRKRCSRTLRVGVGVGSLWTIVRGDHAARVHHCCQTHFVHPNFSSLIIDSRVLIESIRHQRMKRSATAKVG